MSHHFQLLAVKRVEEKERKKIVPGKAENGERIENRDHTRATTANLKMRDLRQAHDAIRRW
jgi:hypothetical protein